MKLFEGISLSGVQLFEEYCNSIEIGASISGDEVIDGFFDFIALKFNLKQKTLTRLKEEGCSDQEAENSWETIKAESKQETVDELFQQFKKKLIEKSNNVSEKQKASSNYS